MRILLRTAITCLVSFLVAGTSFSQEKSGSIRQITGDYFGMKPPGLRAELFAPGILSTGMHDDAGPIFSIDGREVYFRIAQAPHGIIAFMKRENNVWSEPEIASFSGRYFDGVPSMTLDGKRLYFASYRPLTGKGKPKSDEDIWYVERTASGWSEPVNPGKPVNTVGGEWGASVSANGTLYYTKNSEGKLKILRSPVKNGRHIVIEDPGNKINQYDAACPCIAPDESFIVFTSSDNPAGIGGGDLYVCFLDNKGNWTEPASLGKEVNSEKDDYFPSLSPDGRYLFFVSDRERKWSYSEKRQTFKNMVKMYSGPLNGRNDIYWVSTGVIESLKPDFY